MKAKHVTQKQTTQLTEHLGKPGMRRDRVYLDDKPSAHWSGNSPLSPAYDELYNKLVPSSGPADTIEGELLRAISKIIYRHYNDGDVFSPSSFDLITQAVGSDFSSYDGMADKVIQYVIDKNGQYTPNNGIDWLDSADYGPEDEYDDDEDEEDDWQHYDDEDEDDMYEDSEPVTAKAPRAKKPLTAKQKMTQVAKDGLIAADSIRGKGPNTYIFRRGYYYRHGMDERQFAERVSQELTALGISHKLVDCGDKWAPFKGGASLASQSHFWAVFTVSDEPIAEGKLTDPELIRARNKASTQYPNYDKDTAMLKYLQKGVKDGEEAAKKNKKEHEKFEKEIKDNKKEVDNYKKDHKKEHDKLDKELDKKENKVAEAVEDNTSDLFDKMESATKYVENLINNQSNGFEFAIADSINVQHRDWTGFSFSYEVSPNVRGEPMISIDKVQYALQQILDKVGVTSPMYGVYKFREAAYQGGRVSGTADVYFYLSSNKPRDKYEFILNGSDAVTEATQGHPWLVYDEKTKDVKKRFKTREGAVKWAEKNGGKHASSAWWNDNIKTVNESDEPPRAFVTKSDINSAIKSIGYATIKASTGGMFDSGKSLGAKGIKLYSRSPMDVTRAGTDRAGDIVDTIRRTLGAFTGHREAKGRGIDAFDTFVFNAGTKKEFTLIGTVQAYPTYLRSAGYDSDYVTYYYMLNEQKKVNEAVLPGGEGSRPGGYPAMITNSALAIHREAAILMQQQVKKYKKHEAGTDTIPAGPDTSKFRATRSGMIEYAPETTVHGGTYGLDAYYQNFVKIGGLVDRSIKEKMEQEFENWLVKYTGDPKVSYITADGYHVRMGDANGTNWGGYGLEFNKLSDSQIAHYKSTMSKVVSEGTNAESDVANAVVAEIAKLISDGHTEVAPDVITAKVSAAIGKPFMLKDLVSVNNSSSALQHYISTINPTKIKFSTDILTVKNEDPAKEKEKAQSGVANMAARAAGRNRLAERKEQIKQLSAKVKLLKEKIAQSKGSQVNESLSPAERKANRDLWDAHKNKNVVPSIDRERYTPMQGLEGPYRWKNGRVVYYDPREGKYYDRDQDMYIDNSEVTNESDDVKSVVTKARVNAINQVAKKLGITAENFYDSAVDEIRAEFEKHGLRIGGDEIIDVLHDNYIVKSNDVAEARVKKTIIDKVRDILDNGYGPIKFADGSMRCDTYTASAVTKVYDALSEEAKAKALDMMQTKAGFMKFTNFAFSNVSAKVSENLDDAALEADYNTGYKKGVADKQAGKENNSGECISDRERKGYADGYNGVNEGWESGPEERAPAVDRSDWDYEQALQAKLDAKADAQPKKESYQLLGRGPNMEPNWTFGLDEFDSLDDAKAARDKLMADPSTPNPRMISIHTVRRTLKEWAGQPTLPLRSKEDYLAKRKALTDIQQDPDTAKDPVLKNEVVRRLMALQKQWEELQAKEAETVAEDILKLAGLKK